MSSSTEGAVDLESEKSHPRWSGIWQAEAVPAFDKNCPSPALVKALKEGLIPEGRALVPGCGRGYDVTLLASPNRCALGVDIVPIAIDECLKRLETLSTTELPLDSKANCDFQVRNFFEIAETFNFIYDYTFFCALSPAIRDQWARKMADLVVPGGLLMTLIFPIRPGDDGVKGPPHAVSSVEDIRSYLEPVGFVCEKLELLEKDLCHPGRDGDTSVGGSATGRSGVGLWRRVA